MSSGAKTVEIVVNGRTQTIPEGQSLLDLMESLGLDPSRVAVEVDGLIVKRPEWERTSPRAGARLEIVQFVGGG